jgi:hypothetical protein
MSSLITQACVKLFFCTTHQRDSHQKGTFINTIRNGNYATWPKLTVMLINCYYPDLDKTVKGHLKGQRQGIRLTTQKAWKKIIENETVKIKIKGKQSPFHHIPLTKTHKAFFPIEDLSNSICTDQMWAFPFTSQQCNRYIKVIIQLDANYIFVKPMGSRSKEEMIRVHERIINRMRLAGLRLKKHTLDNKALEAFKQCIQEQQMQYKLVPLGNHQCNQADHVIQTFKALLSQYLQVSTTSSISPCGATSSN